MGVDGAGAFYGAVFGWEVDPGDAGHGFDHVGNTKLPMGFAPGRPGDATPVYFRVEDAETRAQHVESLGGRVLGRDTFASGLNITCEDDQGFRFELHQPAPGY